MMLSTCVAVATLVLCCSAVDYRTPYSTSGRRFDNWPEERRVMGQRHGDHSIMTAPASQWNNGAGSRSGMSNTGRRLTRDDTSTGHDHSAAGGGETRPSNVRVRRGPTNTNNVVSTTARPINFWAAVDITTPPTAANWIRAQTSSPSRILHSTSKPRRPATAVKYEIHAADHRAQVPVALFFELKNITNPIDFLNRYVVEAATTKDVVIIDGQYSVKPGRNHSFVSSIMRERTLSAPFAHAAGCTPQPTTIPIQMDSEPYVMYFPSCTRIDRCDGCCNTELLECQPTKTETARLQVLRVKYLGPNVNKFDISEPIVVELEKHLQCDCLCRVKASDCRFYQTYRPNECRCECSNQNEAVNCVGERFWDPGTCQCRCRQHHDCSTGFFFNDLTCSCEMMKTGRSVGSGSKPSFRGFD